MPKKWCAPSFNHWADSKRATNERCTYDLGKLIFIRASQILTYSSGQANWGYSTLLSGDMSLFPKILEQNWTKMGFVPQNKGDFYSMPENSNFNPNSSICYRIHRDNSSQSHWRRCKLCKRNVFTDITEPGTCWNLTVTWFNGGVSFNCSVLWYSS